MSPGVADVVRCTYSKEDPRLLLLSMSMLLECMELMGGKYAQISKQTYGVDVVEDD